MLRIILLAATLGTGVACRDVQSRPARPTTLQSHPRAMERLAQLMRAQFRHPEPARIEQAIACERERVRRAIGPDFDARHRYLTDSLAMEFSAEEARQLGMRLGGVTIAPVSGAACRVLDTISP